MTDTPKSIHVVKGIAHYTYVETDGDAVRTINVRNTKVPDGEWVSRDVFDKMFEALIKARNVLPISIIGVHPDAQLASRLVREATRTAEGVKLTINPTGGCRNDGT